MQILTGFRFMEMIYCCLVSSPYYKNGHCPFWLVNPVNSNCGLFDVNVNTVNYFSTLGLLHYYYYYYSDDYDKYYLCIHVQVSIVAIGSPTAFFISNSVHQGFSLKNILYCFLFAYCFLCLLCTPVY